MHETILKNDLKHLLNVILLFRYLEFSTKFFSEPVFQFMSIHATKLKILRIIKNMLFEKKKKNI